MMNTMKLVLKTMVTTNVGSMAVGNKVLGATAQQALVERMTRHFAGGRKGNPYKFKGLGTSGTVLVTEDFGAGFTKSITRAGSPDKKGAESGNKIWFITNDKDEDSFDKRYHLGKSNLTDARSSAGKNGLTELFGVYATEMAAHSILGTMKFRRIYIIHPRYTDWVKLEEKEKAEAAGLIPKKVKTATQEEEQQKKPDVIKLNKDYLQLVMQNATKMIDQDSRIILLHPTQIPYSTWGLAEIATKCKLKLDSTTVFDKLDFPGFSPRRAGTGVKLDINEAMFYSYRLLRDGEQN